MAITMIENGRPVTVFGLRDVGGEHIENSLVTDFDKETQEKIFDWIHTNLVQIKTPNMGHTSYGLKHILERDTGIYMGNNAFKDAMLICGFKPVDERELNWHFYLSKKSPAFKIFKK
jgi:hypothetical protein